MESDWRRTSITTPTRCLRCVPRLTSCGQLRFISAIVLRASFPVWTGCLFVHLLLSTACLLFQRSSKLFPSIQTLRITGKRRLWVSFHRPPSPTPTQGLFKKYSHPSIRSERPVSLLWLACTCRRSLGRIVHSAREQKQKNKKRTLRNKIHTLALNSHLVSL